MKEIPTTHKNNYNTLQNDGILTIKMGLLAQRLIYNQHLFTRNEGLLTKYEGQDDLWHSVTQEVVQEEGEEVTVEVTMEHL